MIKPDPHNWEAIALRLEAEMLQERDLTERYKEQVQSLQADVDQLKTIIEYLEMKLGINNPI